MQTKTNPRNSSIELYKIIAILMITICHVTITIGRLENPYIDFHDYVINIENATTDPSILGLVFLRYLGQIGNNIFFVCSAWFLLDSKKVNVKKWFFMLTEVWTISVAILLIVEILRKGAVSPKLVIASIFPTTFGNNWYMTCYLLFYLIHPALNKIIHSFSKQQLLRAASVLAFLYLLLTLQASSTKCSTRP